MTDPVNEDAVDRGAALMESANQADPMAALRALERLFDDPGLTSLRANKPSHPAVVQHAVTSQFADQDSESARHALGYGLDLFDAVTQSLALITDQVIWSKDETFWELLEDPATKRFLTSRLPKPQMYRDVLVELTYWASLRSKGYEAALQELDGLPDLKVEIEGTTTWIEAKHIHLGTRPSRVRKVIEKANKQIKSADPKVAGLVYIHLSRDGQRAEFSEGIPNDVQPFVDEVRRALSGTSFRRIGKVVLSWDKSWLPRQPVTAEQPMYVMAAVRNSSIIEHADPLLQSMLPNDDASVLNTSVIAFDSRTPRDQLTPYVARDVEVSDMLRSTTERSQGLTPLHLVDIIRDPTAVHRHELGQDGSEFVLATRFVTAENSSPEVILVEGTKIRDGRLTLLAAFRMFGSLDDLASWSSDPTGCFLFLLQQFGIPVGTSGVQAQLLFESIRIPLRDRSEVEFGVSREVTKEDKLIFLGVFRQTSEFFEASWLHAIDLRMYEQSLSKHL